MALVGAAAAVFSLAGFGSYSPGAARASLALAALWGASAGGLAGIVLGAWEARRDPGSREATLLRVGLVALSAGALVGAGVGQASGARMDFPGFVAGGAAAGLLFLPACCAIVDAARRAARARSGSIVAAADRRSVWSTSLAAASLATLAQVPALLSGCATRPLSVPQHLALALGVGVLCLVALLGMARSDARGSAELDAVDVGVEIAGLHAVVPARVVDVGLGDARWARGAEVRTYRTAPRTDVVLRGDPAVARGALAAARRGRAVSQLLAMLGVICSLGLGLALDVREAGGQECFRRVRRWDGAAGCPCVAKARFEEEFRARH